MLMIWRAERNVRKRTKTSQIEWCCEASFNRNSNFTVLEFLINKRMVLTRNPPWTEGFILVMCEKKIISAKLTDKIFSSVLFYLLPERTWSFRKISWTFYNISGSFLKRLRSFWKHKYSSESYQENEIFFNDFCG